MANQLNETINTRDSAYGGFDKNAETMQNLKDYWRSFPNWQKMHPFQREALDMAAHKIARLLHGDVNLHDSWHDVAGYMERAAQLLADPNFKPYVSTSNPLLALLATAHVAPTVIKPSYRYDNDGNATETHLQGLDSATTEKAPPDLAAYYSKTGAIPFYRGTITTKHDWAADNYKALADLLYDLYGTFNGVNLVVFPTERPSLVNTLYRDPSTRLSLWFFQTLNEANQTYSVTFILYASDVPWVSPRQWLQHKSKLFQHLKTQGYSSASWSVGSFPYCPESANEFFAVSSYGTAGIDAHTTEESVLAATPEFSLPVHSTGDSDSPLKARIVPVGSVPFYREVIRANHDWIDNPQVDMAIRLAVFGRDGSPYKSAIHTDKDSGNQTRQYWSSNGLGGWVHQSYDDYRKQYTVTLVLYTSNMDVLKRDEWKSYRDRLAAATDDIGYNNKETHCGVFTSTPTLDDLLHLQGTNDN